MTDRNLKQQTQTIVIQSNAYGHGLLLGLVDAKIAELVEANTVQSSYQLAEWIAISKQLMEQNLNNFLKP